MGGPGKSETVEKFGRKVRPGTKKGETESRKR